MNEVILAGIPLKDCLTILAILFSPWIALWIQRKLDAGKEKAAQRLNIFKTLMATRASVLSLDHIKALNMIDIEFYGDKKYREVRKSWKSYLHARSSQPAVTTEAESLQFNKACEDTLMDLLVKMGNSLGYDFDETYIRQSIYKPQGHVTEENYQIFMRMQMARLFSGNFSLPMEIKALPISLEEAQEQKKLRTLAIEFLEKKLSQNDSAVS